MTPFFIWSRRGVGKYVALLLFGFVLTTVLSQGDWHREFDWATRLTAASLILVCPCVAAAAAYDTARRFRPTIAALSLGAARPSWHIAMPAAAVTCWSVVAYVAVWATAAGVVVHDHGVAVTDWWVFPEVITPLLAAGALGLWIGTMASSRLAAPLAAIATLGGTLLASPWGRGPFEGVTTYGTLTGLQRPAVRAAACVVPALVIALAAASGALTSHLQLGRHKIRYTAAVAVIVLASVVPAAWPWDEDVYVPTREAYGCIGVAPAVCGPRSRLVLLEPVQVSLRDAYRTLQGTPFTQPTSFQVTRYDHYSDLDGAAPLDFDPALVHDGRYDMGATARLLLRPHQCRELFGARASIPILDAQDRILPWLTAVLAGKAPSQPVPPVVTSSFSVIQSCHQMTGDLH